MSVATKSPEVTTMPPVQLHLTQRDGETEITPQREFVKREKGGTYFYSAGIIGHKNVFVTPEYMDLLVKAIKDAETQKDVKNIAYVVMPNHFMWIFKLSANQDDPKQIYAEVKRSVARGILTLLREEAKEPEKQLPLFELFRDNSKVSRSNARKILWRFKEEAKQMPPLPGGKLQKHRVWDTKSKLFHVDSDTRLQYNLQFLADAPKRDRWQLVTSAFDYPYLYIADEYVPTLAPQS